MHIKDAKLAAQIAARRQDREVRCDAGIHRIEGRSDRLARLRLKEETDAKRAKARKALSDELRSGRKRLKALRAAENDARADLDRARGMAASVTALIAEENKWPAVPPPCLAPHKEGVGLPNGPGIYFVWGRGGVEYVGQSVRLCRRAKIGHEHIKEGDFLSFVSLPIHLMTWAECFYIGILRPTRNFGASASHNKYGNDQNIQLARDAA